MNCPPYIFALSLAVVVGCAFPAFAADRQNCPVTRLPERPFVPPAPYKPHTSADSFLYGSAALWTLVRPEWHVVDGRKLPFFREGYDWLKEQDPRLTVVARRLDGAGPLVWNGWAHSGSTAGNSAVGMFMVTGVNLPESGCWEITAHYAQSQDNIQSLTYVVWAQP